mmetsp:Transcript_16663/g.36308  ORF Transcript_16663/g.36308 Transcript_16663/m.36308 type:complete len:422 (-) Transcript_16663:168-1433(-)
MPVDDQPQEKCRAKGGAAQEQEQEDQPQNGHVHAVLLGDHLVRLVQFRPVVAVGRIVVRREAVQKVVVRPRDELGRADLVLVELVSGVDLAVAHPQDALVLGRVGYVSGGVVQKLAAPGNRHLSLGQIGAGRGVVGGVVDAPIFLLYVGVVGSVSPRAHVGRDTKSHAGHLGIQVPVEGVVGLSIVRSGVPDVALDNDPVVVGLGVVADGAQVGKSSEPIRRGGDLGHGGQPRVAVGDVDGGEFLGFGGVEHAFADDHLEALEPGVLEFVVHDGGESFLRQILHTGRDGFRSGPHAPAIGVADNDGCAPGGALGEIDGVAFLAPLAAKGAIVPQIAGVVLVDVADLELHDAKGLFPPFSGGFVELGVAKPSGVRVCVPEVGGGCCQEHREQQQHQWWHSRPSVCPRPLRCSRDCCTGATNQ